MAVLGWFGSNNLDIYVKYWFKKLVNLLRCHKIEDTTFTESDTKPLTLKDFDEMYLKMKSLAPQERIIFIPANLKFTRWGKDLQKFIDINPDAH